MAAERKPKKAKRRTPKTAAAELAIEKRRAQVWDLRIKGKSTRQIAVALKVSVGTAHSDLAAVLERSKDENDDRAETHRAISLARLERALDTVEKALIADACDAQGNKDHELQLKALDRLVRIEERRSKLLGLDAPTKVDTKVTTVALDEIDELRKSAKANECSPEGQPKPSEPSA